MNLSRSLSLLFIVTSIAAIGPERKERTGCWPHYHSLGDLRRSGKVRLTDYVLLDIQHLEFYTDCYVGYEDQCCIGQEGVREIYLTNTLRLTITLDADSIDYEQYDARFLVKLECYIGNCGGERGLQTQIVPHWSQRAVLAICMDENGALFVHLPDLARFKKAISLFRHLESFYPKKYVE